VCLFVAGVLRNMVYECSMTVFTKDSEENIMFRNQELKTHRMHGGAPKDRWDSTMSRD
jgi:hypothetical protein